jgi:hypothetical protein
MNPTRNLARQKELLRAMLSDTVTSDWTRLRQLAEELDELHLDLSDWLAKGGFLPDQWERAIVRKPSQRHPCKVCKEEIGWDAPSGVCSVMCSNTAQGFNR